MKKLNITLFLVGLLTLLVSCDKNDNLLPDIIPNSYSNKLVLNDLKITGDTVKLTWSKLDTLKFAGYLIIRKEEKGIVIDPSDYSGSNVIARVYDPNVTSYIDKNIPMSPYLEYQVIGLLTSNYYSYNYIFSNSKTYERPNIKVFKFNVLDILPDLSNNRFYFIEKNGGKISILNYQNLTIEKSITTNATIGYCSIGTYNNVRELYVPRNDGWVFVYNAETLEKIDQIDIGHPSSCVVNNNGKLFISTDAWTNKPLKVFSRATKQLISENGDFDQTMLRIIPNSNTEIIEVTINIGPTDLDYYKFDSNGNFQIHSDDWYHGDYPLNANIFQFFPNGTKFITSSEGAIYDVNMNYLNRLPKGDYSFSDYAFNSNSSQIYCSCSNSKAIVSYSLPDYVKVNEYKTKGYPYKIFRKENVLICISKTSISDEYYDSSSNLIIEMIQI
jgi:hypothetical protein